LTHWLYLGFVKLTILALYEKIRKVQYSYGIGNKNKVIERQSYLPIWLTSNGPHPVLITNPNLSKWNEEGQ